jgi:radical SAM superfamily enzyme YgiQ (UPF0313 family)
MSWLPLGLSYIASACLKAGHEVKIYNQDVYHWPESHLTDLLNKERYDLVGLGAVAGYYPYRKVLKISEAINQSKFRPFFVLGGHIGSPEPDYFLRKTHADAIVIGEGDITIVKLIEALEHKKSLHSVKGIAFLENGKCVQTPRQELIQDIDSISFPAWHLFPMDVYALQRSPNIKRSERCMMVIAGRGCTFKCNFCYRMDEGFRGRSSENIVEEIKTLKKNYFINYIALEDELTMSSIPRITDLCESFIKNKLNIKWSCNGRLNYAKADVLRLMKQAGCVFINYGIESLDEQALRNMNKSLTVKQITRGIENTLNSGISPGFNIIFGNIGETKESLQKAVDFLLKYDDCSQMRTIRPVTPYPGCPLYYYAIEKGLLKDVADFYENKHMNSDLVSVNFTNLTDDEFHQALFEANHTLITNYLSKEQKVIEEGLHKLYFEKDITFRGFRHT